MGVPPVDFGDGRGPVPIDESNAKQALEKRKELDLSNSQIKYAEKFLTPEEKDEIFYSENESTNRGEQAIGDKEKADAHGNQTGNAVGTSLGMAAGAAGLVLTVQQAMTKVCTSGWVGLGFGILTLAESVLCYSMAKMFDNAYADRTSCKDNADATNGTLDDYTSRLEDSMDAMNEDSEEYADAIENYTQSKNDNTNRQAEVQMQIQDAEAMGDATKVAELKEQLKGLGETDFSKEEEDMQGIKDRLDEYGSLTDEATGAAGAGESVSQFLKEGLKMGIFATIDAVLLAIAVGYCGVAAAGCTIGSTSDAAHLDFVGAANGYIGAALFAVAVGMTGMAANTMKDKAKGEFECNSAGGDMKTHVNDLNSMIGEQNGYIEQSGEDYEAADDESAESQGEAAKKAGEATSKHGEGYKKEEKDKDGAGAGAGSGGGNA